MSEMIDYTKDWIPPLIVETEYRLYHDDEGRLLFYTCEKPEGKFIVIDKMTYAECRPDLKVIDGRLIYPSTKLTLHTLVRADEGTTCAMEDVSIIVDKNYQEKIQKWKPETHEY